VPSNAVVSRCRRRIRGNGARPAPFRALVGWFADLLEEFDAALATEWGDDTAPARAPSGICPPLPSAPATGALPQ
jgi:hypothetical protein